MSKTDLEILKNMLKKAGVVYKMEGLTFTTDLGNHVELTISTKTGERNHGYIGFEAAFYFDEAGKLLATGVWE